MTQLTVLVEDLSMAASKGKQTDLILLDFSKAFDKVNHSKLIWKLHQYGPMFCAWFKPSLVTNLSL